MKSIKRGRGPSMMGGVMSIFAALFGAVWIILAASIGGGLFALFGVFFVGMAIANAVYCFKNASGDNRYSEFDITEDGEEPDPLDERFGKRPARELAKPEGETAFCPYCGAKAESDYAFCRKCGRKL